MHSIDKDDFKKLTEGASANVTGYGSGEWDKFKEDRSKLREKTNYEGTIEQSRSALKIVSVPGAVEAWSKCIELHSQTSQFESKVSGDPKGTEFSLTVIWKPGPDIAGKSLFVKRSNVPDIPRKSQIGPGEHPYVIARSRADVQILRYVEGRAGKRNRSIWIYVPAYKPEPASNFPYFLTAKDQIGCITRGGDCFRTNPIQGSTNTIDTPPGDTESSATFRIPQGATVFKARIGTSGCTSGGAATVFIQINGKTVWPSPVPTSSNWPSIDRAETPIPANAKTIRLVANPDGPFGCDDIAWLDARFENQ